ncbi:MAG: hypothetical protein LUF84_04495, partial [Clostridiales bacterium]|nr:hypothetical protein [Clostridiales bacterium]
MEWTCPVCGRQNADLSICPDCGFDRSRDYERYPTLTASLPAGAGPVSALTAHRQAQTREEELKRQVAQAQAELERLRAARREQERQEQERQQAQAQAQAQAELEQLRATRQELERQAAQARKAEQELKRRQAQEKNGGHKHRNRILIAAAVLLAVLAVGIYPVSTVLRDRGVHFPWFNYSAQYDEAGNLTLYREYASDGSIYKVYEYTYDETGNCLTETRTN